MTEPAVAVFISNMSADHSYESAAKFGAIRPVTRGNVPIFKHIRLIEEISSVLIHSSKEDYLIFSGSNFVSAICLAVWLLLHRQCKALLWDARQNSYVPRLIKKDDLITVIEEMKDKVSV